MAKVSVELVGYDDLQKKLEGLQGKAKQRVTRSVLGAGLRTAQKEIRKIAPPSIKDSIGIRNGKSTKSRYEAKVGVNVGKRGKTKFKRWAPLIVLGSKSRFRKTIGGKFSYITTPSTDQLSTGSITANPIISEGFNAAQGKINASMKKAFDRSVAKEAAKAKLGK